jgi:RecA-superfamily ATPases implicated in signal transduction
VPELLNIFNTVWRYFPDRAVVVKSALGWPVHELKIREEEGRVVFTLWGRLINNCKFSVCER